MKKTSNFRMKTDINLLKNINKVHAQPEMFDRIMNKIEEEEKNLFSIFQVSLIGACLCLVVSTTIYSGLQSEEKSIQKNSSYFTNQNDLYE